MSCRRVVFIGWVLLVVSCLFGAHLLHQYNARLASHLVAEQQRQAQAVQRQAADRPWQATAAQARSGDPTATAAIRAEELRLRQEIANLERKAEREHGEKAAEAARHRETFAPDGDPTKGFVRVDDFQDRGQASPSAVFQTLVWAALNSDESTLAKLMTVPSATRARAEALIAQLPEAARANWTPEKVTALSISIPLSKISAVQITGENYATPDEAVVTFRAPGMEEDEKVKVKLTPSGWKVVMSSGMIAKLEKEIGVAAPAAK